MRIQIESTNQLVNLDGVPVRVWHGVTEAGVPCLVFAHRIAVRNSADNLQFEAELAEQLPPGIPVPLCLVLS